MTEAVIGSKNIKFRRANVPANDDIVGYRVRLFPVGQPYSPDAVFGSIRHEDVTTVDEAEGIYQFDLAQMPEITSQPEGQYDVYITAYDDNMPNPNEGPATAAPNVTFDFTPPEALTDVSIV